MKKRDTGNTEKATLIRSEGYPKQIVTEWVVIDKKTGSDIEITPFETESNAKEYVNDLKKDIHEEYEEYGICEEHNIQICAVVFKDYLSHQYLINTDSH